MSVGDLCRLSAFTGYMTAKVSDLPIDRAVVPFGIGLALLLLCHFAEKWADRLQR